MTSPATDLQPSAQYRIFGYRFNSHPEDLGVAAVVGVGPNDRDFLLEFSEQGASQGMQDLGVPEMGGLRPWMSYTSKGAFIELPDGVPILGHELKDGSRVLDVIDNHARSLR